MRNGYTPVIRADLDGEHSGWTYVWFRMTPVVASWSMCGDKMAGLLKPTSFHPRSSATMRTMLGGEEMEKQVWRVGMTWLAMMVIRRGMQRPGRIVCFV